MCPGRRGGKMELRTAGQNVILHHDALVVLHERENYKIKHFWPESSTATNMPYHILPIAWLFILWMCSCITSRNTCANWVKMYNITGSWIHLNVLLVFRVCKMITHIVVDDVLVRITKLHYKPKTEMHRYIIYCGSPSVRDTNTCIIHIVSRHVFGSKLWIMHNGTKTTIHFTDWINNRFFRWTHTFPTDALDRISKAKKGGLN